MRTTPLTVNIMTAALTPGDAISNFVISTARIWRRWGAKVNIYADQIAPEYGSIAQSSHFYKATGQALLWYHYSIYADNIELARASHDFKIMDYHGICPPHLFSGHNAHLEFLCQEGINLLPSLNNEFDSYVIHSEYSRQHLTNLGYPPEKMNKLFFCIDTAAFEAADAELSKELARLNYLLFVGRIVPQKDIIAMLEIFGHVHRHRPDVVLVLVGSRQQTEKYQRQLDRLITSKGLTHRVLFTGQVNNPAVLAALFGQAKMHIVTSEWESFCVPVAESLYFGVPAIVHNVAPLPEVAGPGGLVIDKANAEEAAAKIVALLDDTAHYRRLSQAATEWAQQYTDEALTRNIQKLLTRILDLKGRLQP